MEAIAKRKGTDLQLGAFALSSTGVAIEGEPDFEAWYGVYQFAERVEGGALWWIGDLLNYGEQRYGEMYSQALETTGYKKKTLRNAKYVSGSVQLSLRRDNLDWHHHATVSKFSKTEQRRWLDKAERNEWSVAELRKQIKDAKREEKYRTIDDVPDDACELIEGDIAAVQVPVASYDWIITDPPYPEDYLEVYDHLAEFAAHSLKSGGSLICMIGQSYLPRIVESLCRHLTYHWTAAYMTPGGQAVQLWDRKVNTFWKPLLWFVKGEYQGDWIGDVCRSDVNDNDKRFHDWGQSESGMADIIGRWTKPGDTICDPFCGGGTTGFVALKMGRKFVGIDKDKDALSKLRTA